MKEKEEPVQERNLRHIFFGFFFFGILIFLGGIFLWETQFKNIESTSTQTLGVSTRNASIDLPEGKDAQKILSNIQKEISTITPENIASSDSAILKIIGDLQSLRNGDKSAFETVCSMVCKK